MSLALSLLAETNSLPDTVGPSYAGMCDASAGVALDNGCFVVASDEDSLLRVYGRAQPGLPLRCLDLAPLLELEQKAPETDIEGAARLGDLVYWITSHGRNAEGRERANRGRFFATRFRGSGAEQTLELVGKPCKTLLQQIITEPKLAKYDLAEASSQAPKTKNGFNIEGLCDDGRGGLLIGFRNPIPKKQALVVPLLNPGEVVQGSRPRFGDAIELDLAKLGVRDLARFEGRTLILAGPRGGGGRFALYEWGGPGTAPVKLGASLEEGLTPEAAIFYADTGWRRIQLLSDDGTRDVDGCACKDLTEPSRKSFRSIWVELGTSAGSGGAAQD